MTIRGVGRDVALAAVLLGGSWCGDTAAQVALTLRLHATRHSPWAVTALLLAGSLPAVLCAPLTGFLADRYDSRTLLVTSGLVSATLCLALAGAASPWPVLALVSLIAVASAVLNTTVNALVPVMAGREALVFANAMLRGATLLGGMAGLSLGGTLTGVLGPGPVLVLDAASFGVLALGAGAIRARRSPRRPATPRGRSHAWLRESFGQPLLLTVTVSSALVGLCTATTNVVQVFFLKDVVGVGDAGYGLIGACWMAGMVAAVPLTGRVRPTAGVLAGATVAGAVVTGLALLGCGVLCSAAATGVLYVVGGLASGLMLIARGALVQLLVPEEARGRALAAFGALMRGTTVAALGLAPVSMGLLGAAGAFAVAGAGSAAVAGCAGVRVLLLVRRHGPVAEPAPDGPAPPARAAP